MAFDAAGFLETIHAPAVETEAQRVLREAKTLIQKSECWIKGDRKRDNAYCILGAVTMTKYGSVVGGKLTIPEVKALADGLPAGATWDGGGHPWGGRVAGSFNDRDGTTHADVLALFDRAYILAGLPEYAEVSLSFAKAVSHE